MQRLFNLIVWSVAIGGIVLLVWDKPREYYNGYISYKTILELTLFGISAFLTFKRVFFYRIKGNLEVIRLIRNSEHQSLYTASGIALSVIYLIVLNSYGTLRSFDTILIAILFLFYLSQLWQYANPSIYIDNYAFSYDDFFVKQWPWKSMTHISLADGILTIASEQGDFELDLSIIDDIDYVKLSDEVEQNILDGSLTSKSPSELLKNIIEEYAQKYELQLIQT